MKIDFLPYQYQLNMPPYLEWLIVYFILAIIVILIFMRMNSMFQAIQEQITRLASAINNLAVHITALTQERDALKAQVAQLQAQVDEMGKGLPDIEAALQAQVDAAAALFPA